MAVIGRRHVLGLGLAVGAGAALGLSSRPSWAAKQSGLSPITGGVKPIGQAERLARVAKLQGLMRARGFSAVLIEPGASMTYFTGVRWHRSERLTAALIPVEGDACIVTPHFEEPSVRETLAIPGEVRVWQEDENPLAVVAAWLRERKLAQGVVGVEETVRYFAVDGLRKVLPDVAVRSAAEVVRPCRMVKSQAELDLMQAATDVTISAYRHTAAQIRRGMTPADIAEIMNGATEALGGEPEFALILLGEASAYPHGSGKPQQVRDGEVVLMDCGCNVQGYQSDVSRTLVFGEPNKRQREVWGQVRQGQQVALEAARIGAPAGSVDDAVRAYYAKLGYGPGYRLPGLSHRTGHGIGLDGHEPVNLVHGETTALAAGMCFSNEPGLYIPGAFGVRLEDCFHMTEAGLRWFSTPPTSIDQPFG